jgi:serine/threonine-protein kinase
MTPTTTDRDERLASLIEHLAGEQRAGCAVDVDAVARTHPDLAAELRELWAVAQFAHAIRPRSGAQAVPASSAALSPAAFRSCRASSATSS